MEIVTINNQTQIERWKIQPATHGLKKGQGPKKEPKVVLRSNFPKMQPYTSMGSNVCRYVSGKISWKKCMSEKICMVKWEEIMYWK